jgi:DNA-directed RNA polymerase specialized sigma24 family protein
VRLRESEIVSAAANGELSNEEAFERLYDEYGSLVRAWLCARVDAAHADDLFQDVWGIFYRRWLEWERRPEFNTPDARPVLSFLFRTSHLVLQAHRRTATQRATAPLDRVDPPALNGYRVVVARIQLGECLEAARRHCSDEEVAVLTAKLSGVPAREIARTLQVTEAAVDHRFRRAIARIRTVLGEESHA